jgi:hypothetical protein
VTPFGRCSNGLRTGFAGCASHSPYNPLGVRRRPNALPWGRAKRFARIAARRAWRAAASFARERRLVPHERTDAR